MAQSKPEKLGFKVKPNGRIDFDNPPEGKRFIPVPTNEEDIELRGIDRRFVTKHRFSATTMQVVMELVDEDEYESARGYIAGLNLLAKMRLCSNVPGQSIIQTSLGGYQSADELLQPGGRIFEQREYIYNALNQIPGISVVKPSAAFYIFPKVDVEKFGIHSDEQMCLDLLKREKILVTSGTGFHWPEPDHFRIVYLPNLDTLQSAMRKLTRFFGDYYQG